MDAERRSRGYEEIRACLAEADRAFAGAGAADDESERRRLIEEAEAWLVRAEARLARLADRHPALADPTAVAGEARSFAGRRPGPRSLVWRRTPKA